MDLDSLANDQPIQVSSKDEVDIHADTQVETEDTSVEKDKAAAEAEVSSLTAQPSFPNVNEINRAVGNLKKYMDKLEIEVPGDLKKLPGNLEEFQSSILVLTTKVVALENFKLDIPGGLLALPRQVSSINDQLSKLKVLDALPSLTNRVVEALDQFATAINSTSHKADDQSVPSVGQAGTHLPEGGEEHMISHYHSALSKKTSKGCC
ncbi:hypothetical protein Tco_1548456 [Tanacetum coccineum]